MTDRIVDSLRWESACFRTSQMSAVRSQVVFNSGAIYALLALDFLFFHFFPTLALIVAIAFVFIVENKGDKTVKFLLFLLASYLSLINVTKFPESDLWNYINVFNDISNGNYENFRVVSMMREQGFFQFIRVLTEITDDEKLFVLLSSFFAYLLFLYALNSILQLYGLSATVRAFYIISAAFFPFLFSLSSHIIRQFMAASILVYSVSMLERRRGLAIVAFLLSISFHISVLFFLVFVPIAMQAVQRKKSTIRLLLYYCFGAMVVLLVIAMLLNNPLIALILSRASGGGGTQLLEVGLFPQVFNAVVLGISLSNIFFFDRRGKWVSSSLFNTVNYITMTLSVLIIIFSVFQINSEITTRYLFYQYFFVWLILPPFVQHFKEMKWVLVVMAATCTSMFFFYLEFGPWHYADTVSILGSDAYTLYSYESSY
jgi:hypothetical protein